MKRTCDICIYISPMDTDKCGEGQGWGGNWMEGAKKRENGGNSVILIITM